VRSAANRESNQVVPKKHKSKAKLLIPVCRRRTGVSYRGGPGRAGPALTGFFVEPFPLDFWKLERSYELTARIGPLISAQNIRRLIRQIRPLSPYRGYACLTVITYFIVSSPNHSASVHEDARRCSATRCFYQVASGLLVVAVMHAARRRHSKSESPEIPGRIVFFVTAVGRSPPSSFRAFPGDDL
jgi:hypothetical protein